MKETIIPFNKLKKKKLDREYRMKYRNLLQTLSISEIQSEIDFLISLIQEKNETKAKNLEQGKIILEELSHRSNQSLKFQIDSLITKIASELTTLESKTL
ncbi:MAG: hypothetical protein H6621_03740 [Halobacteriovoraceae bacterium]|nr:hypothetical protein [Halobacteriovoraceae bacterium]MCB9094160.1 hypothetical protein [Halobacteriovoraceae bacterium]